MLCVFLCLVPIPYCSCSLFSFNSLLLPLKLLLWAYIYTLLSYWNIFQKFYFLVSSHGWAFEHISPYPHDLWGWGVGMKICAHKQSLLHFLNMAIRFSRRGDNVILKIVERGMLFTIRLPSPWNIGYFLTFRQLLIVGFPCKHVQYNDPFQAKNNYYPRRVVGVHFRT